MRPDCCTPKFFAGPHAHARIKSINTSKAEAAPGVRAVITGQDVPTDSAAARKVMAKDKVLYKGHPVAAVAATSAHDAEQALALIEVEYEILKAATEVREAMAEDAELLHDDQTTEELGEKTDNHSNIATHFRYDQGDLEQGFAAADIIVEKEYSTATVHQGYIEPQNGAAFWNMNGELTIWVSTQGAFTTRDALAGVLDLPVSKIKVIPMEIGGGFGGKIPIYLEPLTALLSRKAGAPVKSAMTRAEVFEATGPTSGSYMHIKMGATNDGKIVAAEAMLAFDAGAFPGSPVTAGAQCMFACYDIENCRVDGYDVVANKPPVAAYRAPGAPIAAFACETVVDELAEKLGLDPIEFRLRNASKEGTRRVDGPVFPVIGNVEQLGSRPRVRAVPAVAGRLQPRARRRLRLLVQHRPPVQRLHQRAGRRYHLPGGRLHRHRWHPRLHRHAGRRGAGHPRRGRGPDGGRHRRGGLHLPHRRQPHYFRHRLGRLRVRPGNQAEDDRAGRQHLGCRSHRR